MYIFKLRRTEPLQGQNYLKIDVWEDMRRQMELAELEESPRLSHRGRKVLLSALLCRLFR